MKKTTVAVATALALFWAANAGADQCSDLIVEKCTACHQISRVCKKVGKKSKSRWKRTLKRMVRHGTEMSKEESGAILTCLLEAKAGVRAMCE